MKANDYYVNYTGVTTMKLTTLAPAALLLLSGSIFAQDNAAGDAAGGAIADPSVDTFESDATRSGEAAADAHDGALAEAESYEENWSAAPDFASADTDKDGLLSIEEAQAAMPDLAITDDNGDGFVNQSEVETALSGLAFESEGYTGGSSLVSESEYDLIVSKLDEEPGLDSDVNVDADVDGGVN
jgi:hypothetical protein